MIEVSRKLFLEFQAYNSIMRGYFCIGFIDYMFNNKRLIDLASTPYYFTFDKKSEGSVVKSESAPNQHLPDELHKPIIT